MPSALALISASCFSLRANALSKSFAFLAATLEERIPASACSAPLPTDPAAGCIKSAACFPSAFLFALAAGVFCFFAATFLALGEATSCITGTLLSLDMRTFSPFSFRRVALSLVPLKACATLLAPRPSSLAALPLAMCILLMILLV